MKVFTIYDGRTSFWQWDLGQRLTVCDDACSEVHFWNGTTECALVCKVYSEGDRRVVNVPNALLRSTNPVRVYAYTQNGGSEQTVHSEIFNVIPRTKPDNYVYTETEVWTAEKAVAEALQEAKESGEFKGDPGPKGDPGVVKFVVVTELPQDDTENAIYLLPNEEGAAENLFDEYIFVDGKWEKIGSAAVAVNLDEYVKKTDYASSEKHGVVKVAYTQNGLYTFGDGWLSIWGASANDIDAKSSRHKPIVTDVLDYAVKVGMTTNAEEWTEEEKQAARELIGAVGKTDAAELGGDLGLVKLQHQPEYTGITLGPSGQLCLHSADSFAIDKKTNYRAPITPSVLDYAVKVGVTTNTETLTDEEKAAACEWLGAVGKQTANRLSVYAVDAEGNHSIIGTAQNALNTGMIPLYGNNGVLAVAEPVLHWHAATKGYVDGRITANEDGTLTILLADGSKYRVNATKEE